MDTVNDRYRRKLTDPSLYTQLEKMVHAEINLLEIILTPSTTPEMKQDAEHIREQLLCAIRKYS